MSKDVTRRRFLELAGLAGVTAGCYQWIAPTEEAQIQTTWDYRTWEDFYRRQFTWDKVVSGSHAPTCIGQCAIDVFVKDGVILRAEQSGRYPVRVANTPDIGPRGCQKGLIAYEEHYRPDRILYPLKRVGRRGERKWQRVSWDQALTEIADKLIDIIKESGPGAIRVSDVGGGPAGGSLGITAFLRFTSLLGTVGDYPGDIGGEGDNVPGQPLTFGRSVDGLFLQSGLSVESWFHCKYIMTWCQNYVVTRIPDVSMIYHSRYNGGKVVHVGPNLSPTARMADLWLPVRIGNDAALALGMLNVIIGERLHDVPYIREQTDLTHLVRTDNKKLLRESDIRRGGKDDRFYVWDLESGRPVLVDESTLALGTVVPALEGVFEAKDAGGQSLRVRPAFESLIRRLTEWPLERCAEACGLHAETIRKVARELAAAPSAMIVTGWNIGKWYHALNLDRLLNLLLAVTGNIGKPYSGRHSISGSGVSPLRNFLALHPGKPSPMMSAHGWYWFAGDHRSRSERYYNDDREGFRAKTGYYPDEMHKRYEAAIERGWQDKPPAPPRAWLGGVNLFRMQKGGPTHFKDAFLRKLDLFVQYDVRMSSTAAYADYVLPGAFYYERPDVVFSSNFAVVTAMSEAMPPPGEAKTYWQYFRELSKKISERARARGFPEYIDEVFTDESGKPVIRDLANLHRDFTANGELEMDEQVADAFLAAAPSTEDLTYKELAEQGFAIPQTGAPDFVAGEAYTPYRPQVEKKVPYPTYSGRQTYYVDHEWFIELGEEIPTHKPPLSNDKYPIFFNSGHTRVGVHSTFRTNVWMQRLQRGGPYVYLSPVDMRQRGIADGDMVRIYNNIGETECMAKIDPGLPSGMLFQYHGFEPYQFKGWRNKQAVLATAINPLELVNGWGHLKAPHEPLEKKGVTMAPNCKTHDVTVEVEKI